jgi:hypothetical protein
MYINLTFTQRFIYLYIALNVFSSYLFILGNVGNIILLIILLIFYLIGNYLYSFRIQILLFNKNDITKVYFIKLNYILSILNIYKYKVSLYKNNLLYLINNIIYIYTKMILILIISNDNIVQIWFNNLLYYLFYNIRYYKKLSQLLIINILNKKLKLLTIKL